MLLRFVDIGGGQSESVSMMKTHESSYINENGKEKTVAKIKEQR